MRPPLRIAVSQPRCTPGDVAANVARHAEVVRATDARLIVFPELSSTGYVLDGADVDVSGGDLRPIVDACRARGSTALVGAPVREGDRRVIAHLGVTGSGVRVAYRKTHLGGDEPSCFAPGAGPAVVEVDGWRVGIGICRDTRMEDHVQRTLALGIDLYVAGLVHAPHEADELEERARRIVEHGGIPVGFASAAGEAGPSYPETAGRSSVWDATGDVLASAGSSPGEVAIAELPGAR